MKFNNKKYLPVWLDISDKKILIVGGGKVALQKLKNLSQFTENITILAKEISQEIQQTGNKQIKKEFQPEDINNFSIVYACTNNQSVNAQIKEIASEKGILINVVDNPALCDFISPAVYKRDYLTIAVCSNGVNVKESVAVRDQIKVTCKAVKKYLNPLN